jgi:type IV secretory pathway TrbD component
MCNNGGMTRRKIILLGLLVLAVGIGAVYFIWQDAGLELICYVFAVPVMVWNMWEWFDPEIMDKVYGAKVPD